MSDTLNPQKRSQGDFALRLEADPYFSDITVLEQNKGVTEDDILQALGTLNEKAGKIGACVVVLMPELVPTESQSRNAAFRVRATLQVIVSPIFNSGDTGTGKTAEAIAAKVRTAFHMYDGGYGTWTFAGQDPIERTGDVSYGVVFTRQGQDRNAPKLPTPMFDPEEGALPATVTITADSESDVYYTTDGSTPTPENPAAVLYATPVEITAPTTLRAAAYRTGYQASNITTADFGTNFEFSDEFSDEFA